MTLDVLIRIEVSQQRGHSGIAKNTCPKVRRSSVCFYGQPGLEEKRRQVTALPAFTPIGGLERRKERLKSVASFQIFQEPLWNILRSTICFFMLVETRHFCFRDQQLRRYSRDLLTRMSHCDPKFQVTRSHFWRLLSVGVYRTRESFMFHLEWENTYH